LALREVLYFKRRTNCEDSVQVIYCGTHCETFFLLIVLYLEKYKAYQ
jgi:hypothetical protein